MDAIKDALHKLVGGLFMEPKGDENTWIASMGRVMLWLVFGHMLYSWSHTVIVDQAELAVFYALLGYAGFKITTDTAHGMLSTWKGDGATPTATTTIAPANG